MAIASLDLQPWIDRIKAQTSIQLVDLAAMTEAAMTASLKGRDVAAFIIEPSFAAGSNPNAAGRTTQQITYQVPVILAVRRYGDRQGGKAALKASSPRSELWAALVGWQPNGNGFAVELANGSALDYREQHLYLLDTFRFQTRIDATP